MGAQNGLHSDIGSAFLGLWRSTREEQRPQGARRLNCSKISRGRLRPTPPVNTSVPHPEADRTRSCSHRGTQPPLARRAGQWALERRDGGARDDDPESHSSNGCPPRRASYGLGHVRMRPTGRAELGQVIADGPPESVRSNPEVATAYRGIGSMRRGRGGETRRCLRSEICRSPTGPWMRSNR